MKKTIIITVIVVCGTFLFYISSTGLLQRVKLDLFAEVQKGEFEILSLQRGINCRKIGRYKRTRTCTGKRYQIKYQDSGPGAEGTLVKEGDYIATLDRTELNNNLKDAREQLLQLQTNREMKLLDTAIVLNDIRDEIKNQRYIVEEAAITLRNSKYEPPTVIRQAEIDLDKSQRVLEQRQRSYTRRLAQSKD